MAEEHNSSQEDVKPQGEAQDNTEENSQELSLEQIQEQKAKALEELHNVRKARKSEDAKLQEKRNQYNQLTNSQENPNQGDNQENQSADVSSDYQKLFQELQELKQSFNSELENVKSQPVEEAFSQFLDDYPDIRSNETLRNEFNSMYDRIRGNSVKKQDVYSDMQKAYYAIKGPDLYAQEQQYNNTKSFLKAGSRASGEATPGQGNSITPKMQMLMQMNNISEEHARKLLDANPDLGK